MVAPKKVCPRKRVYFKSRLTCRHYCLKGDKVFVYRKQQWDYNESVTRGLAKLSFEGRLANKHWEVMQLPEGRMPCP